MRDPLADLLDAVLQHLRFAAGQAIAAELAVLLAQRPYGAPQPRSFALRYPVAPIDARDAPFELFDLVAERVNLPAIVVAVMTLVAVIVAITSLVPIVVIVIALTPVVAVVAVIVAIVSPFARTVVVLRLDGHGDG